MPVTNSDIESWTSDSRKPCLKCWEWQRSSPSRLPAVLSESMPDKSHPGPGKHRQWLGGWVFLIWVIPAACFVLAGRQTGRSEQSGVSAALALLLNTPGICSQNPPKVWESVQMLTLPWAEIKTFPQSSACERKQTLGVSMCSANDLGSGGVLNDGQLTEGQRMDRPSWNSFRWWRQRT